MALSSVAQHSRPCMPCPLPPHSLQSCFPLVLQMPWPHFTFVPCTHNSLPRNLFFSSALLAPIGPSQQAQSSSPPGNPPWQTRELPFGSHSPLESPYPLLATFWEPLCLPHGMVNPVRTRPGLSQSLASPWHYPPQTRHSVNSIYIVEIYGIYT